MLILTQSDELNRTYYDEDNDLPIGRVTNTSSSCNDARRNRASFRRESPSQTARGNLSMKDTPSSNLMGSTGTLKPDGAALKETRATLIATRPKTITTTLAVSAADRRKSSELHDDISNKEEKQFNQNQGSKRKTYRTAGILKKQRLAGDEEGHKEQEEPEGRTSQFGTSAEEERGRTSLTNPVQSPSISTTSLTPSPTITAWEAGWNVTNAIQVHSHNVRVQITTLEYRFW